MVVNSFEWVATTGNPSDELASTVSSACLRCSSFGDTRLGRVRRRVGRNLWTMLYGPCKASIRCECVTIIFISFSYYHNIMLADMTLFPWQCLYPCFNYVLNIYPLLIVSLTISFLLGLSSLISLCKVASISIS